MKKDDASLTVWLPAELQAKIDGLAEHYELTRSDIIRNSLLLHAYGRIRYEGWTSEGSWRPKRKATREQKAAYRLGEVRFYRDRVSSLSDDEVPPDRPPGRRTEFIRQHGKSEETTRVFLPELLKRRIEEIGSLAGLPASEHCRRTLADMI
jgi:hypothetical protein